MKLDAHITELSANGDLHIDLSREVDVRLRFEPWSAGLRVYRCSDGIWLREAMASPFLLGGEPFSHALEAYHGAPAPQSVWLTPLRRK